MSADANGTGVSQWLERQLLPPRAGVSIAEVVHRGGWIPSAGGTGPYLAFRARIPGIARQQVDEAVFRGHSIVEVPCVRDTAMLVPRDDAGVALAAGRRAFDERLRKLPVGREIVESLADRVLKSIGDGVRSIDQLRRELREAGGFHSPITLISTRLSRPPSNSP